NLPFSPLGTTTKRFDLNNDGTSLTQAGYTAALPGDTYTAGNGYGWETAVAGFDRGAGLSSPFASLLRDAHWGSSSRTFRVDVAPGFYLVSVKMGDATYVRDQMRVTNADNSQVLADNITTAIGQFAERSFVVRDTGGKIRLTFSDQGGSDPYWVVNAVE